MIRTPTRVRRAATLAMLVGSISMTSVTWAQEPAKHQPTSPASPGGMAQATVSRTDVVAIPVPLPLPGQLQDLPRRLPPHAAGRSHLQRSRPTLQDRVGAAMEAARIQPERTGFVNAIQVFPYTEGALYQIYAKPGQVTDIALQDGEQLVGTGPVAAGDTVRWMIGDTIADCQSALEPIADIACSGQQVLDIGDDTARLLDEYLAVFRYLGAARCPLEQLDTKPDFKVLHLPAQS